MELNANFNERVAVHSEQIAWTASPMPGVDRRMLDRLGGEVARATSIVRYAANSHFSPHVHTGGEEFFVLDGVFQDEHGDFPAGSYIRNPPETSHTPGSDEGCTIFVKLWQFDMADRMQIRVNTNDLEFGPPMDGVATMPLFSDVREIVSLERWEAGRTIALDAAGGMEVLVLEGGFEEDGEMFVRHSWLRLPAGGRATVTAGLNGTRVWIKRGHLAVTPQPPPV
ncbi:MAG: cupin domain-containing protein [Hyphomicrobiaceae bacterium]